MGLFADVLAALVLVASGAPPSASAPPSQTFAVTPGQLKWQEYREKGWPRGSWLAVVAGDPKKPCGWLIRYRMPGGYVVPAHENSDVEAATVLMGAYAVGFGATLDRARATAYPIGSYIRIDKGVMHYGWAIGDTVLEVRPVCDATGLRRSATISPRG